MDLKVLFDGKPLQPEKDGYLGENFQEGKKFTLRVRTPMPALAFVLTKADDREDAVVMKNNSPDPSMAAFSKKVLVKVMDGVMTTDFHENYLMAATNFQEGKCHIREIAIISQDGLFFLTEQLPYGSVRFFKDKAGQIFCPQIKWPGFAEAVKPLMADQALPDIDEYTEPGLPDVSLRQQQGLVLWWSLRLGMGAILLDSKGTMARVHWKELAQQNGDLRCLKAGQKIHFTSLLPVASNRTGFKLQVKGITVLK